MKTIQDLEDLLMYQLQNLYAAEEQVFAVMPQIIDRAHHGSLKNALSHHAGLTAEQKKRLEKIADLMKGKRKLSEGFRELSTEDTCAGMQGLIDEAKQLLETHLSNDVTDAAIIASVQKMEHYEITTYGTVLAYARQLHLHNVETLLTETLNEEYDADDILTALATAAINKEAVPESAELAIGTARSLDEENIENGPASRPAKVSITERSINSPGGRAGTSHRRYGSGESRGH